jgi:hypothetical protein
MSQVLVVGVPDAEGEAVLFAPDGGGRTGRDCFEGLEFTTYRGSSRRPMKLGQAATLLKRAAARRISKTKCMPSGAMWP